MDCFIKIPSISLERTLFCGQAFRWQKRGETDYFGVVGNRELTVRQGDNGILLLDVTDKEVTFWEEYFDIATDYEMLIREFSKDDILAEACRFGQGIRVLRQPPFETLITFIISQNNNIKRITGIVDRLCEAFGERTKSGYAFPSPLRLSELCVEDLAVIRAGFRARYILDAAKKVASGELQLEALYQMDGNEAKAELCKVVGVGDKVADCVLLFAYGKTEAVPKDVWIKRALSRFYPDGLPSCVGEYAGIAQQFLFEYIRNIN